MDETRRCPKSENHIVERNLSSFFEVSNLSDRNLRSNFDVRKSGCAKEQLRCRCNLKIKIKQKFEKKNKTTMAKNLTLKPKARRRGLVVKVKTHVQEVVSSNPGPAIETIYHAPLIWIKSMKAKIVEK